MSRLPDTRASLLVRVGDPADTEAWREFAGIYRPAAYRIARRRGLQDADAEDLAQRVLVAVSERIGEWSPASPKGSFRAWLSVVARNLIVNALTRRRPDNGRGGSSVVQRLAEEPAPESTVPEWEEEYRRSLFRLAADDIRPEFHETTWRAFWLTAVEGESVSMTAQRLARSAGVVYASRSRVMRRLKERVRELESKP